MAKNPSFHATIRLVPGAIALEQPAGDACGCMMRALLGNEPVLLRVLRSQENLPVPSLLRRGSNLDSAGAGRLLAARCASNAPGGLAKLVSDARPVPRDHEATVTRWGAARFRASEAVSNLRQKPLNRFVTLARLDREQTKRRLGDCPSLLLARARRDERAVEGPAHLRHIKNGRFPIKRGFPIPPGTAVMLDELRLAKALLACRVADINCSSASSFQSRTPREVATRRKRSRAKDVLRRLGARST